MFEILQKDLLGRIGVLHTRRGRVETPLFLPVISPTNQVIDPRVMKEKLGCEAVITNAYILLRRRKREALGRGVHEAIGFDSTVMTDSGGYQILEYGELEITPEEIASFQEDIGTDIAVVLDIPTGDVNRERALETVKKTIANSKKTIEAVKKRRALWVGPVQGGTHLDLVRRCSKLMAKMPFDLHALGSPTILMEGYRFPELVRMIYAAKANLPPDRPLHLFGAGHPMIFGIVVSLGCDMFDSAAYSLYARNDRYITAEGTYRLGKMKYFPCACEVCSHHEPKEMLELSQPERKRMLATHNLYACFEEMKRVKQAIVEGSLWELIEARARGHPALQRAFRRIAEDEVIAVDFEKNTPVYKRKGLFLYDRISLRRPEVRRHLRKILENYSPPRGRSTLVLIPYEWREMKRKPMCRRLPRVDWSSAHFCYYGPPLGIVPKELARTFPLSQNVSSVGVRESMELVRKIIVEYISRNPGYSKVVFLHPGKGDWKALARACSSALRRRSKRVKVHICAASRGTGPK